MCLLAWKLFMGIQGAIAALGWDGLVESNAAGLLQNYGTVSYILQTFSIH